MTKKIYALLFFFTLCSPVFANGSTEPKTGSMPLPLVLTLFIHDQISPVERAALSSDYLEWFIKELNTLLNRRVVVIAITDRPGYTDFHYRPNSPEKSISQWTARIADYIEENNLPLTTRRHKYILLTKNDLSFDSKGKANSTGGVAIASLKSYTTLPHEIGHLLGATHENAEASHTAGLPCRTIMYPTQSEFVASCYRFSDTNRQAIADALSRHP